MLLRVLGPPPGLLAVTPVLGLSSLPTFLWEAAECQRGMVTQEELDDKAQHVPRRKGIAPSAPHTPHCFPTSPSPTNPCVQRLV